MRLSIQRQPSEFGATIGCLYVNGIFQAWTLEDIVREIPGVPVEKWKVWGKTAIPVGEYRCSIRKSEHFGTDKIHIEDVPGFSEIMIHEGNNAADTDGCILVGAVKSGPSSIGSSRDALKALQPIVHAALVAHEEVVIQILAAVGTVS